MGGASYKYDGLNNRVQQTVGANITKYLLDLQPGLAVVLSETTGANIIRNVHAPRGIHAHKDTAGAWEWMVQDGLGSVREVVDNTVGVLESRNYDPYGTGFGATGTSQSAYGFTGEPRDGNGLNYHRARYLNPQLGVWASLDPFEGTFNRPMSLNGYAWVEGNLPNAVDPTGNIINITTLLSNKNYLDIASALSEGVCKDQPITTTGICHEQCKEYEGSYNYITCVGLCQLSLIDDLRNSVTGSAIETHILGSTVTLATIAKRPTYGCNTQSDVVRDKVTGSQNCISRNSSLGTIVPGGIMTHEHYFNISKVSSEDSGQSLNYINTFDWLYIGGSNSHFEIIPISDIRAEVTAGTGKMLIKLPFGTTRFGKSVSSASVDLSFGDPVYFAYYPGLNAELGHYPPHEKIQVGVGAFDKIIPGREHQFVLTEYFTSEGDSGGGHFNVRGELIGVLFGEARFRDSFLEELLGTPVKSRQAAARVM